MASAAQKRGCLAGGKRTKPKTSYPDADAADRGLDWMVENLGARREQMRAYQCRYSPAHDPHWHVGHIPGDAQKHYGRMPQRGGRHRR